MFTELSGLGDNIADEVLSYCQMDTDEEVVRRKALEEIDKQIRYQEKWLYWLKRKRKMYE